MKIKLAKSEIIHFIGIGGIGMSGLSLIMKGKDLKFRVVILQVTKILRD
jgi:UDP-N-acetylmuramate--alanine ligase